MIEEILELNKEGKTSQEIADILNMGESTVRRKLREAGVKNNIKRTRSNDPETIEKIKNLVEQGYTNKEIATILNMSPTTARKYTKQLGLETNSIKSKGIDNKEVQLTEEQEEVLYDSLLGDMYIGINGKLPRVSINHGGDQEEYFDHKCEIFKNLLGKVNKTPRYDKRTQKYYNRYAVRLLAHPIFQEFYNNLYKDGIKIITKEWLNKVTPRGLAFWFMDDGCNAGTLATNCFTEEECELVRTWLEETYNIKTTLHKTANNQHVIYIKSESRPTFYNLVSPYFIPSMMYKLHNWNP